MSASSCAYCPAFQRSRSSPALRSGRRRRNRGGAACRRVAGPLRIPENLWSLSPLTFSGGEQQRANIARGFVYPYQLLLLDEPTASLDPRNRRTVVELIAEAKLRGAAMVGIFHDVDVRREAADREVDVSKFNRV